MHACYDLKKVLAQVDSKFIEGAKTLNTNVPESKWVLKRQKIYQQLEISFYLFFILKKTMSLDIFFLKKRYTKKKKSSLNKKCCQKQVKPFIF